MRSSRLALLFTLAATPLVGCSVDGAAPPLDTGGADTSEDAADVAVDVADAGDVTEDVADTADAVEDTADVADTSEDVADAADADVADAADAVDVDAADTVDADTTDTDTTDADTADTADVDAADADVADTADADADDTDTGDEPILPPDTDEDGVAAYPWGGDTDDDDDGVPYRLDVDDADATVGLPDLGGAELAWDRVDGFSAGSGVVGMVSGDFNRDGHMDVATTNQDSGSATVFLSDGARGFATSTVLLPDPVESGGGTITTLDVDRDGDLDLVFERVFVAYNNGDGTFETAETFASADPTLIFPWDVDGDGFLDVLLVMYSGVAQVVFGGEGGLAGDPVASTVSDDNAYGALAEIDGEAPADLWITSGGQPIEFASGNADGTFDAAVSLTEYALPYACNLPQVGDFNGDGFLDLVTFDCIFSNGATIGFGAGDGTLTGPESFGSNNVANGCVADFNGDGFDDVFVPAPLSVNVVLGGESSRTLATVDPANGGRQCTTGDYDSDGLMDVAVTNFDGAVSFYFARPESD